MTSPEVADFWRVTLVETKRSVSINARQGFHHETAQYFGFGRRGRRSRGHRGRTRGIGRTHRAEVHLRRIGDDPVPVTGQRADQQRPPGDLSVPVPLLRQRAALPSRRWTPLDREVHCRGPRGWGATLIGCRVTGDLVTPISGSFVCLGRTDGLTTAGA